MLKLVKIYGISWEIWQLWSLGISGIFLLFGKGSDTKMCWQPWAPRAQQKHFPKHTAVAVDALTGDTEFNKYVGRFGCGSLCHFLHFGRPIADQ